MYLYILNMWQKSPNNETFTWGRITAFPVTQTIHLQSNNIFIVRHISENNFHMEHWPNVYISYSIITGDANDYHTDILIGICLCHFDTGSILSNMLLLVINWMKHFFFFQLIQEMHLMTFRNTPKQREVIVRCHLLNVEQSLSILLQFPALSFSFVSPLSRFS